MKGKIPATEIIYIEDNDHSKNILLAKGLINEIKTTGIVEREPGFKVRVNLLIIKIILPQKIKSESSCKTDTSLGRNVGNGLSRAKEFFSDYIDKSMWLFFGYIDGEKKIPILITYYESINMTIYTLKLKDEEKENFLISPN